MSDELLPYVEVNPNQPHTATVIWLHGLGDSGNGFSPTVPALQLPSNSAIRFVFPHAPIRSVTINNGMEMRAWYDIKSVDFNQRADLEGVLDSCQQVTRLIEAEIAKGIPSERILLAGFSQGGVIVYHLGLRFEQKLAGILAMSTYMCAPKSLHSEASDVNKSIHIMSMHGTEDPVVPRFLGHAAYQQLYSLNYAIQWQEYQMDHSVCPQQIVDISRWLQQRLN
jgi:phospholipase/carboxylesterase